MNIDSLINKDNAIGLVASNSINYITTTFESLKDGKIIVPLRNAEDVDRIHATGLTQILTPEEARGWFSPTYFPIHSDATALISFTSGTEGAPKGVILSHRAINDVVERMIDVSGIDASACEYIGVPVYHSFGFGRCRLLGTIGGRAYIPINGFNPSEIAQMLREEKINSLSAVPSLLRILLKNSALFSNKERERLRWVEIGSQPMSGDEKIAFRNLFPNANIMQHYGLTEASRTSLLRIDNADVFSLNSVGKAYGHTEISINESGRIRIRGPHLATALLIEGKIHPLTDTSGWFETTDLGQMEDGFLFFKGRADNVINCGGQKIAAELIEEALYGHFDLSGGLAISRIPNPIYGEAVLIVKASSCIIDDKLLIDFVADLMRKHGISASNALSISHVKDVPVTETGKINRKQLANLSLSETSPLNGSNTDMNLKDPLERLLFIFQSAVGNYTNITPDDSIETLGLDSILVVSISMSIEKMFGQIPLNYRILTIRELAQCGESTHSVPRKNDNRAHHLDTTKGSTDENPKSISLLNLIREDFETHNRDIFSYGFWAVFNNRFGNWRMGLKPKLLRAPFSLLYKIHQKCIHILCGIKLDYTVKLGRRVKIEHFGGMILGAKEIGDDVTLRQNTTLGVKNLSNLSGKPTIEQGVNIGAGAVIVGDIRIGRYSVIGPNAVVEQDVPPFSFVSAPKAETTSYDINESSAKM